MYIITEKCSIGLLLILLAGLSRIEMGRKRQALVPDYEREIVREKGETKMELAELKTLSCCLARSNMAPPLLGNRFHVRAVDRRANGLTALYRKKARKVNRQYGGTPEGEMGRVERNVEV